MVNEDTESFSVCCLASRRSRCLRFPKLNADVDSVADPSPGRRRTPRVVRPVVHADAAAYPNHAAASHTTQRVVRAIGVGLGFLRATREVEKWSI
jgi:hypothetical protein